LSDKNNRVQNKRTKTLDGTNLAHLTLKG